MLFIICCIIGFCIICPIIAGSIPVMGLLVPRIPPPPIPASIAAIGSCAPPTPIRPPPIAAIMAAMGSADISPAAPSWGAAAPTASAASGVAVEAAFAATADTPPRLDNVHTLPRFHLARFQSVLILEDSSFENELHVLWLDIGGFAHQSLHSKNLQSGLEVKREGSALAGLLEVDVQRHSCRTGSDIEGAASKPIES